MVISLFILPNISAINCNFHEVDKVNQEEIPISYTEYQLQILEQLFLETWILIEGSSQMNEEEFCELNHKFFNNKSEEVIGLALKDIWILTKGTAQMSEKEFNELKIKYHLIYDKPEIKEIEIQSKESENNPRPKTTIETEKQTTQDKDLSLNNPIRLSTQKTNNEKLILNSPIQKPPQTFTSKQEKIRLYIIYTFTVFTVIIIILLALRKL